MPSDPLPLPEPCASPAAAPRRGPAKAAATAASDDRRRRLDAAIAAACGCIPPLWTLRNFVAVNPYLGFAGLPFHEAIAQVERLFHAPGLMPLRFYRDRLAEGRIAEGDLVAAAQEVAARLGEPDLALIAPAALRTAGGDEQPSTEERVESFCERLDREAGTAFAPLVTDELAKWCAARFDAGQAAWSMPWAERDLYAAWREAACVDRSPELRGLKGFRHYVRSLPSEPRAAIATILDQLGVAEAGREGFLARQLASLAGWAGHVQYRVRRAAMQGREDDALVQLLAVRLAYEGGVQHAWGERPRTALAPAPPVGGPTRGAARPPRWRELVGQVAFEAAYRRRLLGRLSRGGRAGGAPDRRPQLHAVFCIDVRSEVLRRHLEAMSPRVRTSGFAGFFGFPIEALRPGQVRGSDRCPALIAPTRRVREVATRPGVEARLVRERERHRTFKALRLSTVSSFSFVEALGPLFGLRLLGDSLGLSHVHTDGRLFASRAEPELEPELEPRPDDAGHTGLAPDERVALAEGMLRNLGLVDGFAEVVLLCGHGSCTTNNPYGSGLDCGACGGHRGDLNARVAAAVLEDPQVRRELAARGIRIPDDTRFVAAVHETTTDDVRWIGGEGLPPEARARTEEWLREAGRRARDEREQRLRRTPARDAGRASRRRSRDWSEVRPEWGLARNAAFVAAPRERTRGLDLDGRVFLHDYEPGRDPEGRVLELILSAPLVVASWINLQYYASTVAPDVFGSGNKVLHNVVGRHGVMLGNRSDLRPGLPWQSLHDGVDYVHEPMRLLAVVEAPLERIEAVLEAHPEVRELVENDWVRLVALEPGGHAMRRWVDGGFRVEEHPGADA